MGLTLRSITCHKPSETDKDEIFIKYRGEKLWPSGKFTKIDADQTVHLNIELDNPTIWVEIELWEYDYLSRNDHLGDFVFKSQNYPGTYTHELKPMDDFEGKVEYSLTWELTR